MMTTWLLDSNVLERLVYGDLLKAIKDTGNEYILIDYKVGDRLDETLTVNGPFVVYGCHPFCKEYGKYYPGVFGVNDNTRSSIYMSNLPLHWFLNRDADYITWSMFKDRFERGNYNYSGEIFVRPDSGFKTFSGQRMLVNEISDHINTLDQTSSVTNETMIMVNDSLTSDIKGEFRFVVVNGKVIAGSEYRWDGKLDVRRDWPEVCYELAKQVAEEPWQLDSVYTVDVCLTYGNVAKIVELNSFSCAGLYACDLNSVVDAVSKQSEYEYLE